ncbi:MAG: hypothetical protein GXP30_00245, partial [Verrucomicrobia bacterium]|nr:hypothetical protein [Verrucomicrobiota bacterium]
MDAKRKYTLSLGSVRRLPGRDWVSGWIALSLVMMPIFPGGQWGGLPFSQLLKADGDSYYCDPGYYAGESAGDPSTGDFYSPDDAASAAPVSDSDGEDVLDSDGDGLSDENEIAGVEITMAYWVEDGYDEVLGVIVGHWEDIFVTVSTDPYNSDTDGDRLPDGWEVSRGFDPTNRGDGLRDDDSDGLDLGQEYELGTDWLNPDTDGDGLLDGDEVLLFGSDPNNPDDPTSQVEPEAAPATGGGGGGKIDSATEPVVGDSAEPTSSTTANVTGSKTSITLPVTASPGAVSDGFSEVGRPGLKFKIGIIKAFSSVVMVPQYVSGTVENGLSESNEQIVSPISKLYWT